MNRRHTLCHASALVLMLTAATTVALAACQHKTLPDSTASARELYEKYATHPDLTVALVGDYHTDRGTYTAVRLQADDEQAWQRLLADFGIDQALPDVSATFDSLPFSHTSLATSMVSVSRDSTPVELGSAVDTLLRQLLPAGAKPTSIVITPSDSTATELGGMVDSLVQLFAADAKKGRVPAVSGSFTLTREEHWKDGERVSTHTTADTQHNVDPAALRQRIDSDAALGTALRNGNSGYLTYSDFQSRTLWLFFYSTADELLDIMHHVAVDQLDSTKQK